MKDKRIVFVPSGPIEWASVRYRAEWVAQGSKEMGIARSFDDLDKAEVIIWQKGTNVEYMKENQHKAHYWDVCDPVWWFSPEEANKAFMYMSGVVACNDRLARDFYEWSGRVHKPTVIKDRFDPDHFVSKHDYMHDKRLSFIWYGIYANRAGLTGAIDNLNRLAANGHQFSLTILDDVPQIALQQRTIFPVEYIKWALGTEQAVVAHHDFAVLPRYPSPWGDVKSDNKADFAACSGVFPVTGTNYNDLKYAFNLSSEELTDMMQDASETALRNYDVAISTKEWLEVIDG